MSLFLVLILLNILFPTVIGVDIGEQLPVVASYRVDDSYTVPEQDDVLGMIDDYDAIVFIAHDYLAGDHIKRLGLDDTVTLLYSNGSKVEYEVSYIMIIKSTDTSIYDVPGAVMFQTCIGKRRMIVIAKEMK